MQLRKALSPSEKATSSKTATDVDKGDEENEDDKLLDEMEELAYAMERKKKRAKKLLAKRQAKVYCLVKKNLWSLFLCLSAHFHIIEIRKWNNLIIPMFLYLHNSN